MGAIFSSQRFGKPQILAGLLLLVFIGQCAWLVAHQYRGAFAMTEDEFARIQEGLAQWNAHGVAGTPLVRKPLDPTSNDGDLNDDDLFDHKHSPLWYLVAAAPVAFFHVSPNSWLWGVLTRIPYMVFGTLLGASVWYVARRLYGNAGGFIALGLYCFSPAVIRSSTLWLASPNTGAAWGTFGAVFTAIAVSHTLYAPREVVLWNWRRIVLLGVSLALAIGSEFRLAIILPVLLGFMLYLAPKRKAAALVILAVACAVALALVFASYFFHPRIFVEGLRHARFFNASWRSAIMPRTYIQVLKEIAESGPVLVVLIPATLAAYLGWRRARYFGNTAPLIVAGLFLFLRLFSPHESDSVFTLIAVIFLFVFVAGIAADLMETVAHEVVSAIFGGAVAANALWDVLGLLRIRH